MELGRRTKLVLKIAASLGLVGWLLAEIGTGRVMASLAAADLPLLALAFLLICGDNLLRSFNWHLLLGTRGDAPRFPDVLYAFLVGGFFGSFVPSSLGPDAARTVGLSSRTETGGAVAASSVVMLNVLGLWALGVVFLAGTAILVATGEFPGIFWTVVALTGVLVGLVPGLLAVPGRLPTVEPESTLLARLAEFVRALDEFRRVDRPLWPAFAIAVANQVVAVIVVLTVFRAGGVEAAPVHFMVLVPLLNLSRLIPASVAGFGAEQGVVVALFGAFGVAAAEAFAMSVALSGLNLCVQALSGLLYVGVSARSLGRSAGGSGR